MRKTAVFVYGTLKRSGSNHHLLAGQEFVGEAQTLPLYRLYDSGPHPCLVENRQFGTAVRGEVWKVDDETLTRLDAFEEVSHTFSRREIDLSGFSSPVFAYFYLGDVSTLRDCGDSWPLPS
jgi:gamma-glutamylcyclotransferase (GGCT)/AIG2-like uncharacterized protein YtfP